MNKTCKNCNQNFIITDEDLKFYDKISPIFNEKKYLIPAPTLCPDCRQQRRLSFRNERNLYHRKCDLTRKQIISIYSPNKPYKVYNQEEWWSDKWNATDYAKDFDFNRTFFDQFNELWINVPQFAFIQSNNENSLFTNFSEQEKDCYLIFASNRNQNCMYSSYIWDSKTSLDCIGIERSELLYNCIDCGNCYNTIHCQRCYESNNLNHCFDCKSCNDLFACSMLRNKSFCILNIQYTKNEYYSILNDQNKIITILDQYKNLKFNTPRLYAYIINSENSTGSNIHSCKNAQISFNSFDLEDAKYVENSPGKSKDVYDISGCTHTELGYELVSLANGYQTHFCLYSHTGIQNDFYTVSCMNCSNLFACISLKHKEYCILNKQYTKQEYEELVPKIIEHMKKTGEWGEFFPISISPFGYNETVANEYAPLTRDEAISKGYKWQEEDYTSKYQGVKYLIPDNIKDVKDDILNAILECEISGRPYKIIPQELKFYREMNLPIPKICPDERHKARMKLRNPRKLFDRNCMKCNAEIKTTYDPTTAEAGSRSGGNRPEIVYCEKCYLKEVY